MVRRRSTITPKQRTLKILEAALPLFAQQGIRKTTIEQIAAEAGIGKGTIYLSFKSKDEIFAAIIRQEANTFFQILRRAVRKEQRAVGQLRAYIQTSVRTVTDRLIFHQVSQEFRQESRPFIETIRQDFSIVELSIIEDILEFGCEQGEFAVADIPFAGATITIAVHALQVPWLYPGHELGSEEKADALSDLIINGLRSREPETSR